MFVLYRYLSYLVSPLLARVVRNRVKKGKEDPVRFQERFGRTTVKRSSNNLIWVHAISVGEANSTLPLISALRKTYAASDILVTTGTKTSADLMADLLPEGVIHQYVPVDCIIWVRRFFDHWEPNAIIWMESELWPNMMSEIDKRSIPAALVNARFSNQTINRWLKVSFLSQHLLKVFDLSLIHI